MKKFLLFFMTAGILATSAFLASCDGDDEEEFDAPTISLSETDVTAAPGDDVTVAITATTDGGFQSLIVKKMWEDDVQDEETFSALPANYTYTVTEEDADHLLKLEFTLADAKGKTVKQDLLITVELTPLQVLLKYDWRLDEEIREKTSTDDIQAHYTDDVYRFHADGTYQKSVGANNDGFNDLVTNYCFYDLNETTMQLMMNKYDGWNGVYITDTLKHVSINETDGTMHADITYYGLDVFGGDYEPVEDYQKHFVAVAKGAEL